MPNPTQRDLYIERPLTDLSTAYLQDENEFISGDIFPVVNVRHQGNLYYKYKKDDWFRSVAGIRAPGTESPGAGWELETDSYYAPVYSAHQDLDDQTIANADTMFSLERDATEFVTRNLLIKRDRVFVDSYMKTGVWGTDITGVAATPGANQVLQWDVGGSTPIENIQNDVIRIHEQTGLRPNALVVGARVINPLLNHDTILERIKYTQRGIASTDLLATLFGVNRVVVANAVENTAPKGASASLAYMVNKSALLVYSAPRAGIRRPSGGYIFAWTGLLGAGAFGTRIKRFRMEPIESFRVEGSMSFDMKVVGADLGVFYDTIVG